MARKTHPETPDGRYFVANGRLWRRTDPSLTDTDRRAAVKALMQARRGVRESDSDEATRKARDAVQAAKERLGERGPVWWDDDTPDETQKAPKNTVYGEWWAHLTDAERAAGE